MKLRTMFAVITILFCSLGCDCESCKRLDNIISDVTDAIFIAAWIAVIVMWAGGAR
jgi:hypothetical protein